MPVVYESKLARAYEEADTATYICTCGFEKEVAEEYDLPSRAFYPVSFADTRCSACGDYMDRKGPCHG